MTDVLILCDVFSAEKQPQLLKKGLKGQEAFKQITEGLWIWMRSDSKNRQKRDATLTLKHLFLFSLCL